MHAVETERLLLRPLVTEDFADLYAILSDPEVVRYVGTGQPTTRAEAEAALQSFGKHWERHGFGRWGITEKSSRRLVGFGGLRMLIDTPEVVYHFAKSHWGRGLATEVARASLRYGFEEHGFERVVAVAMPANTASLRVMQKIGMTREGPANYFGIDVVQYSITRRNYLPDDSFYLLRSLPPGTENASA